MAPRKTKGSNDGDGGGDQVGYGKPPKHTQFRPGQSGNPAGRLKSVRNLVTDVKRTLEAPVKVTEGGRTRTKSTQEGVLMVLREKALKGDARALDRLLELALRFNSAPEIETTQVLDADDQAILDAYVEEVTGAAATPTVTSSDAPHTLKSTTDKQKRPK